MSNKILLEAVLKINELPLAKRKELASKLALPENEQKDLMYMSAILVSTGTNKNGATFLGSELIKARETIALKPLDIDHIEDQIIGHIISSMYMNQRGEVLDDASLHTELSAANKEEASKLVLKLDKMAMDIGIVCVVYRDRFSKIAEELEKGEWKVSMECYYDDFDVKIGELIIPKADAKRYKVLEKSVEQDLKLVIAGSTMGTHRVSRVLRGIKFCGVGIVKNPANDRSVVLEAASENLRQAEEREQLQEAATQSIALEGTENFIKLENVDGEVVEVQATGYFLLKNGKEVVQDSFNRDYAEIAKEAIRRTALDAYKNQYYVVATQSKFIPREDIELNETSEATTYVTDDIGEVKEIHEFTGSKEQAELVSRWGPSESPTGICISFEKYLRERPNSTNRGRIIATHWCKLFNKPCPVLGADPHDQACLRNKYAHLVHLDSDTVVTVKTAINPRSAVPQDQLIELKAGDMPSPKTLDEAVAAKPGEGETEPESLLKPIKSKPDSTLDVPSLVVTNPETLSKKAADDLVKLKGPKTVIKNPYKDFPVQIASASLEERKTLSDTEYGLPEERKFPIHTPKHLNSVIALFPKVRNGLKANQQKRLFNNLILKSLLLDVDTTRFEKETSGLTFKPGVEYSEDYGIPRLSLFPLDSREQIISAMSRFRHIKVEISDTERKFLMINILRAAKKFDIDCSSFRDKFKDLLNS
jgi:hypothetical protein